MFNIDLSWHSFSVSLPAVEAWLKAHTTGYIGCSADDHDLTLHFSAEPDDATKSEVQAYWDGLSETSPEATGYVTGAQVEAAYKALKASCVGAAWDTMTVAQQKCVMGLPLTNAELGL